MTDTGRTRAERALAAVIHEIRDEWDEHGVVVVLRRLAEHPMAEVAAAAMYCAVYRADQRTPACIALPGEHTGALERMNPKPAAEPTYTPPGATDVQCPTHSDRMPCRGCAADAKALAETETDEDAIPRLPDESLAAWAKRIADTKPTEGEQA